MCGTYFSFLKKQKKNQKTLIYIFKIEKHPSVWHLVSSISGELDPEKNIIDLIKRCKEEGKTVIFSTHRFGELKLLCDDLAIIHKGEIYYNGTYAEFEEKMQADSLEDEFIRLVGAEA